MPWSSIFQLFCFQIPDYVVKALTAANESVPSCIQGHFSFQAKGALSFRDIKEAKRSCVSATFHFQVVLEHIPLDTMSQPHMCLLSLPLESWTVQL
jgi:hypothetical protein